MLGARTAKVERDLRGIYLAWMFCDFNLFRTHSKSGEMFGLNHQCVQVFKDKLDSRTFFV